MSDNSPEQEHEPQADDRTAPEDPGAASVEAEVEVLDAVEVDAAAADGEVTDRDAEQGVVADAEEAPAESELETARRERDEYLDLAQRTRAELENYRRRTSGETAGAELRGKAAIARDLLPAVDNLERALLAAGVDPQGGEPAEGEPQSREVSAHTALAEGVALVYRELCTGLARAGVEPFDPTGERFDPASHEAIATHADENVERGSVIEVVEKGYRVGEQVLRPARVVVSG